MDPTTNYYKTKRTLLLFVGALLLSIFAGFKIGPEKISILPFQLEHPEFLTTILFIAVIFYLFQFSLHWAAQLSEVQNNRFHKIDFMATTAIAIASIVCYVGVLVKPYFGKISIDAAGVSTIVVAIATILAAANYLIQIATWFGKKIKSKEASEDKQITNLLKSQTWVLNYNPTTPGKEKDITFENEDTIGLGVNNNESRWRVRNGQLEIMDSAGRLFSRFLYDSSKKLFLHTNDPDTLSIKSQTLRPKS